jgi:hypothetical protein
MKEIPDRRADALPVPVGVEVALSWLFSRCDHESTRTSVRRLDDHICSMFDKRQIYSWGLAENTHQSAPVE